MKLTDSIRAYTSPGCQVADYTCVCEDCNAARTLASHGDHIILVVPPQIYHDPDYSAHMARNWPKVQLVEQQPLPLQ